MFVRSYWERAAQHVGFKSRILFPLSCWYIRIQIQESSKCANCKKKIPERMQP